MELCDLYLKYMNALCEGTLAAPEGIALSGETPEERAMSLQAALKNVSVPDFVRRCARAAGDALPGGLLDGFNEEDFARALFARMALGGAPQPEEPPAPAGEADEPAPDPDAGKHAFEVFCDCLMLDENLIAYLIDVLKANDRAGFYKLSQVTTHLDLDPDEFLYWLAHREDYAETDEERACAVILDACLDRLRGGADGRRGGAALRRPHDLRRPTLRGPRAAPAPRRDLCVVREKLPRPRLPATLRPQVQRRAVSRYIEKGALI